MILSRRTLYIDKEEKKNSIEVSVHELSDAVKKELSVIFPDIDVSRLKAIPTCQRAAYDLVNIGSHIEVEKDRLLETFMTFAEKFRQEMLSKGYFTDYIDPCSGLAVHHTDASNTR